MKISNFYKYSEIYNGNKEMEFGWIESDPFMLSNQKTIISIDKSNKTVKISAAKKSDYEKYFHSLTDESPVDFYKIWNDDLETLIEIDPLNLKNLELNQYHFILLLSKLLSEEEAFEFLKIKYKVV